MDKQFSEASWLVFNSVRHNSAKLMMRKQLIYGVRQGTMLIVDSGRHMQEGYGLKRSNR